MRFPFRPKKSLLSFTFLCFVLGAGGVCSDGIASDERSGQSGSEESREEAERREREAAEMEEKGAGREASREERRDDRREEEARRKEEERRRGLEAERARKMEEEQGAESEGETKRRSPAPEEAVKRTMKPARARPSLLRRKLEPQEPGGFTRVPSVSPEKAAEEKEAAGKKPGKPPKAEKPSSSPFGAKVSRRRPAAPEDVVRGFSPAEPLVRRLSAFGRAPSERSLKKMAARCGHIKADFEALVDLTERTAFAGDAAAEGKLEKLVGRLLDDDALQIGDWNDLAYLVSRRIRFQRPLGDGRGLEPPGRRRDGGKGDEGSDSGSSPFGPSGTGVPQWQPFEDFEKQLEGGTGTPSFGDGILGIHDQDSGPDTSGLGGQFLRDIQEKFTFGEPGMKPWKGGVDGGAYGGINIKYLPGQAADDTPGQKGGGGTDLHPKVKEAVDGMLGRAKELADMRDGKYTAVVQGSSDGNSAIVSVSFSDGTTANTEAHYDPKSGITFTFKPGPDGDYTPHPRQDPNLLYKLSNWYERNRGGGLRPDDSLVDPVPVREGAGRSSAEAETQGAAAGPAGGTAEQKWKFGGKKPGSEVTDPPEPGSGDDEKAGGVAPIKHFQVVDPPQYDMQSVNAFLAGYLVRAARLTAEEPAAH